MSDNQAPPPYPASASWQLEEEISDGVWDAITADSSFEQTRRWRDRMAVRNPKVRYRIVRKDVTYTVEN